MSTRFIYTLGFIAVLYLLGTGIMVQYAYGILPCPLCILQRIAFGLIGILFFVGIFCHRSRVATRLINLVSFIASGFGIIVAGRQVWLQYFPNEGTNECGVSLQYMLKVLPLNEVAQKVFSGSAECTQKGFEFLGLNMAEWSLAWFVFLLLTCVYLFKRKRS